MRRAITLLLAVTIASVDAGTSQAALPAPVLTDPTSETRLSIIPAPRGLIVDRYGEVMAGNRSYVRALLRLTSVGGEAAAVALASERIVTLSAAGFPAIQPPTPSQLRSHWESHRWLPIPISLPFDAAALPRLRQKFPGADLTYQSLYLRSYPLEAIGCHLIGYVSRKDPTPAGSMDGAETLWPPVEGQMGLEKVMNRELTGSDGLLSVIYPLSGGAPKTQLIRSPRPGHTVVLTLDAKMQKLAQAILRRTGRPGAFVVMDAMNGDLLALASEPGFDPNQFVPAISTEAFSKLLQSPGNPFFARAYRGTYPPGSIFKPIVALATLEGQARRGTSLRYQCGPVFAVGGRDFHNWNDHEYGRYDLQTALMRSCNTWFYQAALDTGGTPILAAARAFGLGRKPVLDLDGVSAGALPQSGISGQGLANLAIGQGELLVSPLQMAMVMSGFANRSFVAKPRVILQVQTPETDASVLKITPIDRSDQLHYPPGHLDQVRAGMMSVVNDPQGTGRAAQLNWPQVYGKTGTAQWSQDGRECTLAWFTGFVDASTPSLAFAVVSEGALGEDISGSKHAAPMAGEWLRRVYANPDTYHVSPTRSAPEPAPRKERIKSSARPSTPVALSSAPLRAQIIIPTVARARPTTPVAQSSVPLRAQIIIPKTSSVGNFARIRPLDRFVKATRP